MNYSAMPQNILTLLENNLLHKEPRRTVFFIISLVKMKEKYLHIIAVTSILNFIILTVIEGKKYSSLTECRYRY